MADNIDLGSLTTTVPDYSGSDLSGALNVIGSIIGAGANIWTARKNRQFTEKWNKIQMEREDTAMQRRMKDFSAAGINPLYALGSSGAASGGYNTSGGINNLDFLGMANNISSSYDKKRIEKAAVQQARTQAEIEVKNLDNATKLGQLYDYDIESKRWQNMALRNDFALQRIGILQQLGLNPKIYLDPSGNIANIGTNIDTMYLYGTPLQNQFDLNMSILRNNQHTSQVNANWATANQIFNALGSTASMFGSVSSGVSGLKKAYNPFQPITPHILNKSRSYNKYGYTEYYNYGY